MAGFYASDEFVVYLMTKRFAFTIVEKYFLSDPKCCSHPFVRN